VMDKTRLQLASTDAAHLSLDPIQVQAAAIKDESPWEVTDSGNTVSLEQELIKAGDVNRSYSLNTSLVKAFAVSPSILVPNNSTNVTVSQSGIVTATVAGSTTPTQIGQLTTANFANETGLEHLGSNMFRETPASGTPVVGVPGDPGFGSLSQGYLEASNVDPVKEISDLISAQRAYEMNSKVIQACDQMGSTLTTGTRG